MNKIRGLSLFDKLRDGINMQDHKKFAFDVGITFLASVVTLPLGFVITIALGRYLGAGDLGLYRMTSTIYGIAMLFAAIGIPAAMISCKPLSIEVPK
jgi:O-antigen/teichoic acid export membrane protein